MPDVVEFKPVRARRPHRSVRPKLLNIKGLDRRTAAQGVRCPGREVIIEGQEQLPLQQDINVGPLAAWSGGKCYNLYLPRNSLLNLYWFEFAGKGIWLLI